MIPNLSIELFKPNPTFLKFGKRVSSDEVELPPLKIILVVLSSLIFVVNLLEVFVTLRI